MTRTTKREGATREAWACPSCARTFTRANQRHACGTTDGKDVLRDRPASVVAAYGALETFARTLGPIEIVTRERYVLFRSARVFTDVVVMTDAIRIAIHLRRRIDDARFSKIVADRGMVTHVTKLARANEVAAIESYVAEAYAASLR